MNAVSQCKEWQRNYTMHLLHEHRHQFCTKSELPFKAGLMTHPLVFRPFSSALTHFCLSLYLSLSVLFPCSGCGGLTSMWCCFSLFSGLDGRLCSSDSWGVSVQDTPCLTDMHWTFLLVHCVFYFKASTETCTTAYQSLLTQTPFKTKAESAYLWDP